MIKIIVGTETGTAEYVADELVTLLEQNQINSEIELSPDLETITQSDYWIICSSTQGAGEVPSNLIKFKTWLDQASPDLTNIKALVIGLGDSSYDTYCLAAKYFSNRLKQLGATLILPTIEVDAMDEDMPEDIVISKLTTEISIFK